MSDNTESGYTVVELLIAISVLSILIVSTLSVSTNFFSVITRNSMFVDMTVASQNLLRSSVEELRYGSGVRQTNSVNDANEPVGGWSTSNSNFIIIIAVPAVNASDEYIINPDTGNPYNNELVYFKTGTTLFKRILAHPDAVGNNVVTTCPEALASAACPPDRELMEHVDDMDFVLYDQDDAITGNPLLARSVKIDLSMEKDTFGEPLRLDNSIRVTLRNNFL